MSYTVELDREPDTAQQEESLAVVFDDGRREEMRLHEYGRVYAIPGLYEEVVQHQLDCRSPSTLADALLAQCANHGQEPADLRLFDLGAGNGVVGEVLRSRGVTAPFVGLDTEPEAERAVHRDRPGLYEQYIVGGLADADVGALVAEHGLNGLVGAGALGLGHITAADFDATWRAFPAGAWLAVTISDAAVDGTADELGEYVSALRRGEHGTEVLDLRRFVHRLSMSGQQIHYNVLVARRTG